jgi:hypothetical protein
VLYALLDAERDRPLSSRVAAMKAHGVVALPSIRLGYQPNGSLPGANRASIPGRRVFIRGRTSRRTCLFDESPAKSWRLNPDSGLFPRERSRKMSTAFTATSSTTATAGKVIPTFNLSVAIESLG